MEMIRGQVRIFDYNGSAWVQVGADIVGKTANDNFGDSVALSYDGSRVAIGATRQSTEIPDLEEDMLVFMNYNGTAWVQVRCRHCREAADDE